MRHHVDGYCAGKNLLIALGAEPGASALRADIIAEHASIAFVPWRVAVGALPCLPCLLDLLQGVKVGGGVSGGFPLPSLVDTGLVE